MTLAGTVVRCTEGSKHKPGDSKLDRIEIWRNEVAASRLSCACSAPTVQDTTAGPRGSSWPTRRLSATGTLYKNISIARLASPLSLGREEGSPFFSFAASGSEQSERTSPNCSVCASPVGGVAYKWLSGDGSGLVLARNDSLRLLSSFKSWETSESAAEGQVQWMGKLLVEKVSQLFRRGKGVEPPQSCELSEYTSIQQQQQEQQQRADTGALDAPVTTPAQSRDEPPLRSNGTGMYHDLCDGTGAADYDDEDDEMSSTVSDDEGKRPTLGIDKSAARLRRAQRLLNKGV
ncbi:hypothetical protein F5B17DRAFT_282046 [Nemania serpens]|nr:hypothetical protein F5B17DRAFT_282046 [Nemania serpens]